MSTDPADLRRKVCAALAALALVVGLVGCSDGDPSPTDPSPSGTPDAGAASAVEIPPDLGRSFSRLLRQRAAAVISGDRIAFAGGLELSDDAFVADQAAYFDNLRQLPIGELAFDLDPGTLVRSGDDYWGVVDVSLQLDGFDVAPVVSVDRYRFSPVGEGERRFALSAVSDAVWEQDNGVFQQPWDLGPIEVRTGVGVLGIFDDGSAPDAGTTGALGRAGHQRRGGHRAVRLVAIGRRLRLVRHRLPLLDRGPARRSPRAARRGRLPGDDGTGRRRGGLDQVRAEPTHARPVPARAGPSGQARARPRRHR